MQQLALYRAVGHQNRIALGDLAATEYYTADADDNGVITLTPVEIVGATKRTESQPQEESVADPDGTI